MGDRGAGCDVDAVLDRAAAGSSWRWIAIARFLQWCLGNRLPMERGIGVASSNGQLQGIPASSGMVEGVVRVCRTLPSEGLVANTILVVPYTDAGWAPVLVNAAAIVAEVGGQLSHGAIVAREFGIPAVMNVEGVMSQLQDGDRVRVDGDRGVVELMEQ